MNDPTNENGFTLIELLVVMIIIAILMAVAVMTLMGARDKATITAAKARALNLSKWLEHCAAQEQGLSYKNCTPDRMKEDEPGLYADFKQRNGWFCNNTPGMEGSDPPGSPNCPNAGYTPWSGQPGAVLYQVLDGQFWVTSVTDRELKDGDKRVRVAYSASSASNGEERTCRTFYDNPSKIWNSPKYCPRTLDGGLRGW